MIFDDATRWWRQISSTIRNPQVQIFQGVRSNVEVQGLPLCSIIKTRQLKFCGYRRFGICRIEHFVFQSPSCPRLQCPTNSNHSNLPSRNASHHIKCQPLRRSYPGLLKQHQTLHLDTQLNPRHQQSFYDMHVADAHLHQFPSLTGLVTITIIVSIFLFTGYSLPLLYLRQHHFRPSDMTWLPFQCKFQSNTHR